MTSDPNYQTGPPPEANDLDEGVTIRPDTVRDDRLPPRQVRTRKWPVLHAGRVPHIPPGTWRLDIGGLVQTPLSLDGDEFQRLPRIKVFADFHCVTRWSRLGNLWEGVSVGEVLSRAVVCPEAKFVIVEGYDDGWTTNLPLEDFLATDALLADRHDGQPLSLDHGGPVRLIVPRLYAWKSAKWIRRIELAAADHHGYWEQRGYHHHGDPWREERFGVLGRR